LVGREVADVTEIKAMACDNMGYYVHLSTLAEVREQVLNYIPVVARPLVLNRTHHPVIWSQVYADVIVSYSVFFSLTVYSKSLKFRTLK
jgi:voltage-dependent calcium channel alpha-2/delta-3